MKALIIGTNHKKLLSGKPTGAYVSELAHPWAVFTACGLTVEFASPGGGIVPLDGPTDDPDTRRFLERHCDGPELWDTQAIMTAQIPDLLYFAGGHGAMFDFPVIGQDPPPCWTNSRVVGAVCHGVAALVHRNWRGLEVSCFTDDEERLAGTVDEVPFLLESKLLENGCIVRKAAPWQECVTVHGSVVTGQNPASARRVAFEMVHQILVR